MTDAVYTLQLKAYLSSGVAPVYRNLTHTSAEPVKFNANLRKTCKTLQTSNAGRASVYQVCNNLEWDALISDISTYAKKEYQKLFEQQGQIQLALRKWLISQSTHALPYLNES